MNADAALGHGPEPDVTVVIPVYNGARFVREAVESALEQVPLVPKVIVVDDGSTDETPAIVAAIDHPAVEVVRQPNRGHGAAKNEGLRRARTRYVAFLDADDRFLPAKLERQVAALAADPGIGFTVCLMRHLVEPEATAELTAQQVARLVDGSPAWLPSGVVARRGIFAAIGGFDESLRHGNDTDWFARAQRLGVSSAVVPEVLLERRIHGANQTRHVAEVHDELLALLHRHQISRRAALPS